MASEKTDTKTSRAIKEENLAATMRDGTVLRADVYHPDTSGQFPTLLCRTPYKPTSLSL
jgi:predicted acyl esterase